ncbi:MAG: hypothetical protein U5O39_03550 [Gammaproteobacteria bacterium]|nr:hypothetical protein [Gammaproteobacteria bacterium]
MNRFRRHRSKPISNRARHPIRQAWWDNYPGPHWSTMAGLSGQVQYRGMFGPRVGTTVNGQHFHSGGPNAMDPPLHYAPPVLVDQIIVSRGPGGIQSGSALIGSIDAILKGVPYGPTKAFAFHYDVSMLGRSVDQSHAIGGVAGIANERYRLYTMFSDENGHDIDFRMVDWPRPRATGKFSVSSRAWKRIMTDWSSDCAGTIRDRQGNPPFAMDIEYVATDFSQLAWRRSLGDSNLSLRLGYTDVDHGMNNFGLRPAPTNALRYRRSLTGAERSTDQ